jgi:hypothetical protein
MRTLICIALLICAATVYGQSNASPEQQGARTPITLSVESEVASGSFIQIGKDLSKSEVAKLNILISRDLARTHELVPKDYKQKHLFLSVVVTKLVSHGGKTYYAASSAVNVGTIEDHVDYLNHNVILQSSLERLAAAVQIALSSLELEAGLGLLK